ncbi:GtrA family protein [Paenibacillus sp.]|uniref:GtrA family protein n=1 Tax=Paenibacillus sp. TaxID=58172 RepID=UPI002D5A0F5F|nr:GtrA family protein [Paenibacillus sp.]HZG87811.1 GtrA family protein [Paenibacillus sp.]
MHNDRPEAGGGRDRPWFAIGSFLAIGVANALIDIGLLNLLLFARPTTDPTWLFVYNTAAYVSAVVNSYVWNARITFKRHATFRWREKIGFALQAGFALLLNNGVFLVGVAAFAAASTWGVPAWTQYNVAKGLAMAVSSASSFLLMKYVVFPDRAAARKRLKGRADS